MSLSPGFWHFYTRIILFIHCVPASVRFLCNLHNTSWSALSQSNNNFTYFADMMHLPHVLTLVFDLQNFSKMPRLKLYLLVTSSATWKYFVDNWCCCQLFWCIEFFIWPSQTAFKHQQQQQQLRNKKCKSTGKLQNNFIFHWRKFISFHG